MSAMNLLRTGFVLTCWLCFSVASASNLGGASCVLLLLQSAANDYADAQVDLSAVLMDEQSGEINWSKARDITFDVDKTDGLGRSLLHLAVYENKLELAQIFARRGASIEAMDRLGRRPLHLAAYDTSGKMLSWLLSEGADIDAADTTGQTFLHLAAREGSVELLQPLLDLRIHLRATNLHGQTALHLAAAANKTEVMKALLQADPGLATVVSYMGETALHEAASGGHVEAVQFLLQQAPGLIKRRDQNGNTALQLAVEFNKPEVVRVLAQYPSCLNNQNLNQKTALHMAVASDRTLARQAVKIVEILLIASPNIYLRDADGNTAVHLATRRTGDALLKAFLDRVPGFSRLNSKNKRSILHAAARYGNAAAIKLLLQLGHVHVLHTRDKAGQTPLHIAAGRGHTQAVNLFLEWHADAKARDKKKKTPLDLAKDFNRLDVIDILTAFERRQEDAI